MNNKETVTTKYGVEKYQPCSFVKGSKMSTKELNKRFNLDKLRTV